MLDDPVIEAVTRRVNKMPAQVTLAWAVQLRTSFLTISTKRKYTMVDFEVSALPADAKREIREGIKTDVRFNTVVRTGVPGQFPEPVELNSGASPEFHDGRDRFG